MENNKRVTLDIKRGNVTAKDSNDIIELTGIYESSKSPVVKEVQLLLYPRGKDPALKRSIPYDGYNFELFIANFSGDDTEEIMITGGYGGTANYEIAIILDYKVDIFVEIFNQDFFNNNVKFITKYLNNYQVLVVSETMKEEYRVDISKNPSVYLSQVYDTNGTVKENITPIVSNINSVYPIKSIYDKTYSLFIRQKVTGVSIEDKIGVVESFVDLTDDKINIIGMGMFLFGDKIDTKDDINNNIDKRSINKLNDKCRHIHGEFYNCSLDTLKSQRKIISYIENMGKLLKIGRGDDYIFSLNTKGDTLTILLDYGQVTIVTDYILSKVEVDVFTNLINIDTCEAFSYISEILKTDNYYSKEVICHDIGLNFNRN